MPNTGRRNPCCDPDRSVRARASRNVPIPTEPCPHRDEIYQFRRRSFSPVLAVQSGTMGREPGPRAGRDVRRDGVTELTLSIQGARASECPTFIIQNPEWPRATSLGSYRGISYSYDESTESVSRELRISSESSRFPLPQSRPPIIVLLF